MAFTLSSQDSKSKARAGAFETPHGTFNTPMFMPVGTLGAVKALGVRDLKEDIKAEIILSNTYHLYLRPGMEILKKSKGLHEFISWDGPILTDSGGFQVFSLAHRRKISEKGVEFRSHIDGSKHLFTPESVMDIQRAFGSDIMMAFDECPPFPSDFEYAKKSLELTNHWLDRCIDRFDETEKDSRHQQYLFPIVQGSTFDDLRKRSCEFVASKNLEGNAIGGLSVGESEEMLYRQTALCCDNLPLDKPRYLMGVGNPVNLLECISLGVDMFDCVMPTRNARHGLLFTLDGIINIKNKKWEKDFSPIDSNHYCPQDLLYSKAYLRHLFISNEILGLQIASAHNLAFYLSLIKEARERILDASFSNWKDSLRKKLLSRL
jgi:queuine tRNA-ribosyltransferase